MSSRTITKDAPRAAFELTAPGQLAIGERNDSRTPVSFLARTAEPIDHWYWGRFVHDLEGVEHPPSIPVDYCHDQWDVIGVGNRFDLTDAGLTISGELIHFREGDRADEVAAKAKAGVPYQASINFSEQSDDLRLEYIPEGAYGMANGREYEGPITIMRKSFLRGVATCLYGYDRHTNTSLSTRSANADDTVQVTLHVEDTMTKRKTTTNLTDDSAAQDATPDRASAAADAGTGGAGSPQPDDAAKGDTPAAKASDAENTGDRSTDAETADAAPAAGSLSRTELKTYIDLFGAENGAQWALAGKPLAECHQLHAQTLQTQLTASRNETAELRQKLASLSTGEEEPARFSPDAKDATTGGGPPAPISELAANVGPNIARIAAGIKIPKS